MKNLLSLHKRKSMKKLINSVFFIALCSCMAMVSCISDGDDSDTGSIELVAGDKLPVFGVTMNGGTVVTNESLRGKVSNRLNCTNRLRRIDMEVYQKREMCQN